MPRKLIFRWTGPYWIVDNNYTYQVGTLVGEILPKWVNGFRLKPYKGPMPRNPFEQVKTDTEPDTSKSEETATHLAIGKREAGKREHEPANGKNDATASSPAAGKSHNSDRGPVGPDAN